MNNKVADRVTDTFTSSLTNKQKIPNTTLIVYYKQMLYLFTWAQQSTNKIP